MENPSTENENPEIALVDSIRGIEGLHEFVLAQAAEAEMKQKLWKEVRENNSQSSGSSPVALGRKENSDNDARELEEKLQIEQMQQDIIKKLGFANELSKACNNEIFSTEEEEYPELVNNQRQKIKENIQQFSHYNNTVMETLNEIESLEKEFKQKKNSLLEVTRSNQEKFRLLEHMNKTNKNKDEAKVIDKLAAENENLRIARDKHDKALQRLKLMKYISQTLITASGYDWYSDEEMREFYLSLGRNDEDKYFKEAAKMNVESQNTISSD